MRAFQKAVLWKVWTVVEWVACLVVRMVLYWVVMKVVVTAAYWVEKSAISLVEMTADESEQRWVDAKA